MNKYPSRDDSFDKKWPEWLLSRERLRLARVYNQCRSKAAYSDKEVQGRTKSSKKKTRAYACKHCGRWHLATRSKKPTAPKAIVFPQHIAAALDA